MTISVSTSDLIHVLAILAGVLIFVKPKLLSYIVAVYLIVAGLAGLFGG